MMENLFLVRVLFTFCLINFNSEQAPQTQSDRDLPMPVVESISINKTEDKRNKQLVDDILDESRSESEGVIVSTKLRPFKLAIHYRYLYSRIGCCAAV